MSIFAGIYSLDQSHAGPQPDPAAIDCIVRNLSRANDTVQRWSGPRFFLAKIDVGAFAEPGFLKPDSPTAGRVAAVAGHPFLAASREASVSRAAHLATICQRLDDHQMEILRDCLGVFALCYFHIVEGRLILSTDRIGSRPLYYHLGKDFVYFATSLRVLEAMAMVPKRMDAQGVAEKMAIGYSLADRTSYVDVKVLENGTYLSCAAGSVKVGTFFEWDQISPTELSHEQIVDEAYQRFIASLARLSSGQSSVVACLSGGLDSRCVVTGLHELQKQVFALTWSPPGYMDGPLAEEYAKALGISQIVREITVFPTWDDYAACLRDLDWPDADSSLRRNLIFSGDGGSVGVGYDYVNADCVAWMRSGQLDQVVKSYLASHGLPRAFMRSRIFEKLYAALYDGMKTELCRIHSHEPGRDWHIFFMKNDQRRHLHEFFESIDTYRAEYLVPFYDGEFLELLMAGPVDAFLRHDFYHRWLEKFPPVTRSVAWQTYPGHLPCPITTYVPGRTQWDHKWGDRFRGKNRASLQRCVRGLFRTTFPSEYFYRSRLMIAMMLHSFRLRWYTYLFTGCNDLQEVWERSQGRVVFPGDDHD